MYNHLCHPLNIASRHSGRGEPYFSMMPEFLFVLAERAWGVSVTHCCVFFFNGFLSAAQTACNSNMRRFFSFCWPSWIVSACLVWFWKHCNVASPVVLHSTGYWELVIWSRACSLNVPFHAGAFYEEPFVSVSAQLVACGTKLRDQCKGTPCNRYGDNEVNPN